MKLAIYTVLVGSKEELSNPLYYLGDQAPTDLELDFICFTDKEGLVSPTWQIRKLEHPLLPPEKLSRLPKALPHEFLPDYEYSLYIDNTVVFQRLPQQMDIGDGAIFRAFRHPWRSCPLDEADIIVKSGLDGATVVANQARFYTRQGRPLDDIRSLTSGTVLLRKHHHPDVQRFGELWWEQILLFSKRDQISLDLCAREAKCPIEYFDGDKTRNDLFIWPILPSGRRVQSSFDAERYAWENRHDPIAYAHPNLHFLVYGDSEKYTKREPWFRYLCDRTQSGLGDTVPPRRGLADIVERLLANPEAALGNILIVGILSDEPYAAEPAELVAAKGAITQFFRFTNMPTIVISAVHEQEVMEPAPFRAAHGMAEFRLVLVLGLPARCHEQALSKFFPLLGGNGQLLAQFGSGLDVRQILRMQECAGGECSLEIFHGKHISEETPIPSSVFLASRA